MSTIALALFASAFIGASDFFGGLGARFRSGLAVTAGAQLTAFVVLVPVALVMDAGGIRGRDLALGFLTGIATGLAYASFFTALARGRMSVVVPVTALVTAGIPAAFGMATGEGLAALGWAGILCALLAVPLVTVHEDAPLAPHAPLTAPTATTTEAPISGAPMWAIPHQVIVSLVCGFGFAWFFVVVGNTETSAGMWPTLANITAAAIVTAGLTAGREGVRVLAHPNRFMVGSGLAMAIADIGLTRALQLGPLEVAAVLASLYPIVTVLLAVTFLRERLHPANVAGIALAVVGIALLALA